MMSAPLEVQAETAPRAGLIGFDLLPAGTEAARLARHPAIAPLREGRPRASSMELVWHDSPDGALAAAGLGLCRQHLGRGVLWRLEPLHATPPGLAAPALGEAEDPGQLGRALPPLLAPVAAWTGTQRLLPLNGGSVSVRLLDGQLRSVARQLPASRARLEGLPGATDLLAFALAESGAVAVSGETLAAAALGHAGRIQPPRKLGLPVLMEDMRPGDAFATIAGHLAGVLVHWAPLAAAGERPEPVHQMRVALRRLRSAMSLFRRAVFCPELEELKPALRQLGQVLGPARDWDVFIAGIGSGIARALPDDRALARLLGAAERKRASAYATLRAELQGGAFALAMLRLASLAGRRPWEDLPPPAAEDEAAQRQTAAQAMPLSEFAPHVLSRRLSHVLSPGADLSSLSAEELHTLRIEGKRLRYAAEFFAPLFPARHARRFIRRVSSLQDRLGRLNDEAVSAHLIAELCGSERSYAAGLVRGYVAAVRPEAREGMSRAWRKFRRLEAFWT
jgi:CHAD domain-containing protein